MYTPFKMSPKSPVMQKMMEPSATKALKDLKGNVGTGEGQIDPGSKFGKMILKDAGSSDNSGINYGSPVENKHIKAHNPALYGKRSPVPMVGSNQEKTREDKRNYVDDKNVVRSAQMQRLMDNKPPASDKEAMKRWQASYDKAFNAFKKKQGKA